MTELASPVVAKLAGATNRFGFRLLSLLDRQSEGGNVFISPFSVASALAMALNGAGGATRAAMEKALALDGLSPQAANEAAAALLAALRDIDPKVELAIANALWARKDSPLDPALGARLKAAFDSEIANVDFGAPATADAINRWIGAKTRGKIPGTFRPDSLASLAMLLANAIYFKGAWQEPFEPELTKEREFTLEDGRRRSLPMMSQAGEYRYYENRDFQAVRLPYGSGRAALYVFLPRRGVSLAKLQSGLESGHWLLWLTMFRTMDGSIVLPKFKLDYGASLRDALAALGMGIAFESAADFSALCPGLWLSEVVHKTFVEVNEEGTEAAAVTLVEAVLSGIDEPLERFTMIVDRPFFCAICDELTSVVLFAGLIRDPPAR